MFSVHAPALVDYIYLIDRYPEKGGHAIIRSSTRSPGGAGANVAHHMGSLGIKSTLYTTLGQDEDAEYFIQNTKAEIVAKRTHSKTGKVHVFVESGGERTFFVEPNAAGRPFAEVEGGEVLYLDPFPSDESFRVQKEIAEYFEGFVVLKPGCPYVSLGFERLKEMLRSVNMVIMSSQEFRSLGVDVSEILKYVEFLVVTQGKLGSACYTRDSSYHTKAFNARVVDTTGAGDAFAAGFIYCFMKGYTIDVCLKIGNFCGAYNVERVGARNFPPPEDIENFLARVLR